MVSNGGCFQSCERLFPQGLYQKGHGRLSPWGVGRPVPVIQMHYNESRGYPGVEVKEESAWYAPVALDLSAPRSWKPPAQVVELPGF